MDSLSLHDKAHFMELSKHILEPLKLTHSKKLALPRLLYQQMSSKTNPLTYKKKL